MFLPYACYFFVVFLYDFAVVVDMNILTLKGLEII